MTQSATTSIRLPEQIRLRLEQAVKHTRRSRSSLMIEALELHLDEMSAPQSERRSAPRYAALSRFRGAAARSGGRSAEELDAILRDIRGDD